MALIASAPAWAAEGPAVLGVPVDFIVFGVTLLGVALFHRHTLGVAVAGLALVTRTSSASPGSRREPDPGTPGPHAARVGDPHEPAVLLLGFALLSRHFEKTRVPAILPRFLPHDWKGAFIMLVMVFVLSSFLDNIAAALIGGAMAHTLFRAKVHIGYLAAIVAASNAGGSGSVVGDTTTTMMWIDGVAPLDVSKRTWRRASRSSSAAFQRRCSSSAIRRFCATSTKIFTSTGSGWGSCSSF